MAPIDRLAKRIQLLGDSNAVLLDRVRDLESLIAHAKGAAFAGDERPNFPSVEWLTKSEPKEATNKDTWVDL